MTRQELFLNIFQATANERGNGELLGVVDFNRQLSIHVGRSSGDNISHITLEFYGLRSRYLCCILFDGTGDYGVNSQSLAMPKVKLNVRQKSLVLLACLEFLIYQEVIKADMTFIRERFQVESNNGHNSLINQHDLNCEHSKRHVETTLKHAYMIPPSTGYERNLSQTLTF